ncbi:MAG: HAMP domain-containing histidine kinase [Alphaproteobacteria bacterium]|nr:HAMP domain-containing histidine kinase [Alphaproteobacteria bacterium]MBU1512784.1 HAMP domain-containing histidine kinase [Alphaproteobacteria bacterium]MBU2306447.1 HAMP domain-containing histidine kinase [Alphaproteobacteria bacterium]
MARSRATSSQVRRRSDAAPGVMWHAGWALAVAATIAGLTVQGMLPVGPELLALGICGAAAMLGALLSMMGQPGRAVTVLIWGIAGAAACHLTGGTAGPLAAWCLAPAAAATAYRNRDTLALGAAASLAAAAVSALDATLLPLPTAAPALAPWLGLLSLGTVSLGFAVGLIGVQGVSQRDNRRRDRAEQVLALLDGQPLLLALVERSGRVITAAGVAIAGQAPSQVEGRSLGHLVAEADLPILAAALHAAARDGQAAVYVAPTGDPEGSLEISLRAAGADRFVAAVRDSREQALRERRLEAERVAAEQQNAGKSRFLANMSHELRTPLNAIMGFSDIMRQRLFGPMGDRYAEYAELIHESGTHLLELINDVLDMSKIEAEKFELSIETFDARDAVSAVLRLMRGQADRAGVHLRGVLPIGPLYADADRRAVKQIALNLISNALKFTPRGGSVTVTVQGGDDTLELVVADTGVGIAQDDLHRLGSPYEQAGDAEQRAAGSGLGLSLVRAFARLHGGDMVVESTVGEGTTVTIRMPVLAPAAAETPRLRQAN